MTQDSRRGKPVRVYSKEPSGGNRSDYVGKGRVHTVYLKPTITQSVDTRREMGWLLAIRTMVKRNPRDENRVNEQDKPDNPAQLGARAAGTR